MLTLSYRYKLVEEQKLQAKKRSFSSYSYLSAATEPTVIVTTPEAKSKVADYNSYCYYHASSVNVSNDSILALSNIQQVNGISCFDADCIQEEQGVYEE